MIFRHVGYHREDDEAIEQKTLVPMFHREHFEMKKCSARDCEKELKRSGSDVECVKMMKPAKKTTMDVLLESRIDDVWNVDGDRSLSELWTGFTRFTILIEKPPDGYTWSGRRLTKIQATSTSQRREEQQWTIEEPKLDNARMLRSMYFIDPEDTEFKETKENARKSWKCR